MPSLHPTCPQTPVGDRSPLYVVTAISNPWRYRSRYELYEKFRKMVTDAGAILYTVEIAFGNRPFEITDCNNPHHVQLRTDSELWHKENMLNLGIERLPQNWEYVAWIDADITFARPDWVEETLNLLQHYSVVQMFSVAFDLDPNSEPFQRHLGFMYSYINGLTGTKDYSNWHPGFAWACTKKALNDLGQLIDIGILGSGDRHMACALINRAEMSLNSELQRNYKDAVFIWQDRANKYIQQNVGYMPGALWHAYHGSKARRAYQSRWKILINNKFDPEFDLKKDWNGLYRLTERNPKLRDDIRKYFQRRNEDSIDLEGDTAVHLRKF